MGYNSNYYVGVPNVKDLYPTVDDFKAALAANPAHLCYTLSIPQKVTLIGQNNVWSDGGNVSLTYGTVRYTEGY